MTRYPLGTRMAIIIAATLSLWSLIGLAGWGVWDHMETEWSGRR